MSRFNPIPTTHPIQAFSPEVDNETGIKTGIWWAPASTPNEAIQAYFIDGENPQVEYCMTAYPDMSLTDIEEYLDEVHDYIKVYNTATVFDAGVEGAAA